MTVYGAIFAAVSRKIAAFVAECRLLVQEAEAVERKIVAEVEAEIADLKRRIKATKQGAENEKDVLRNDLVTKISKL